METKFNHDLFNAMGIIRPLSPRFALVKFGGGITQMSGSIGGTTFARNRYGNYARARTKPINPNSSAQQAVRATLNQLTVRWGQTLTAAQRAAWNLYGSSVAMTNRLGESTFMTGFNHYIRSNSNLLRHELVVVDDGPTIFELPDTDPTFAITASEATQLISVAFDDALAWVGEGTGHLFVLQGTPQNAQRNFFDGPWRTIGHIDGDGTTPPTSPSDLATTFQVSEGQHVWVKARICQEDGRLSEPFRADVIVAA